MSEQTDREGQCAEDLASIPSKAEALDAEIKALQDRRREERVLEAQRTKLRPQLVGRKAALEAKMKALRVPLNAVERAITEIDNGQLTNYRLRKRSTRKPKAAEAAPAQTE